MLRFAGVTATDDSVAEVTVNLVDPVIVPTVALTVVVPAASVVAMPLLPEALLIVKTDGDDDPQVTWEVRFWVVLSE